MGVLLRAVFVTGRDSAILLFQTKPTCLPSAATVLFPLVASSFPRADIFQWEYINPADPSQGKQQSTTLAPDGAGVDAVPGADFHGLTAALPD
jgi:hypothetical protein